MQATTFFDFAGDAIHEFTREHTIATVSLFWPGIRAEDMDAISYPTVAIPANLVRADIVYFNDAIYIFSKGNIALKYTGTITNLFAGTIDVDYIPPIDGNNGNPNIIAANINGDVGCSAYGRLWVSGVNNDYDTIYYSDLLIAISNPGYERHNSLKYVVSSLYSIISGLKTTIGLLSQIMANADKLSPI